MAGNFEDFAKVAKFRQIWSRWFVPIPQPTSQTEPTHANIFHFLAKKIVTIWKKKIFSECSRSKFERQ